jgi:hypothetical protein
LQPDGFHFQLSKIGDSCPMQDWWDLKPVLKALSYSVGGSSIIAELTTLGDFKDLLDQLDSGSQTGYRMCDVTLVRVNIRRKLFYQSCSYDVDTGDGSGRTRTCMKQLVQGKCPLHVTSLPKPHAKLRAEFRDAVGSLFWFNMFGVMVEKVLGLDTHALVAMEKDWEVVGGARVALEAVIAKSVGRHWTLTFRGKKDAGDADGEVYLDATVAKCVAVSSTCVASDDGVMTPVASVPCVSSGASLVVGREDVEPIVKKLKVSA